MAHKYRCIGYSWILYSNHGPVQFCLWILYQEQRVSPSSPPLPPLFAFVFTSVLQLMRGNVHWYVYHQEANWGRMFMRLQLVNSIFITKSSLVTSFGIIYYKTRKTSGKFLHLFQYTCVFGGALATTFFGPRNFQNMGVGVSLLGMVPVDYSVKNYRSTQGHPTRI